MCSSVVGCYCYYVISISPSLSQTLTRYLWNFLWIQFFIGSAYPTSTELYVVVRCGCRIFSSGYIVLRFFRFECQVQSVSIRASLCDVTSVDSIFFFFTLSPVQFPLSIRAVLCGCVIFSGGYFVLRFFRFGCQVQSLSVRAFLCDVTSADSFFFCFFIFRLLLSVQFSVSVGVRGFLYD